MTKKTIDDLNIENKVVLLRVDFNVPIEGNLITSDKRISAALPTINKLISSNAKVVLFSHLGRIKSDEDKKVNSLEIVAKDLSKKINKNVIFINATRGEKLESAIKNMQYGDVLLLQNTRYEDFVDGIQTNYESKNNPELGRYWASLGDIFINDAFGTAHRSHASNVGISTYIKESAVGYLIEKELKMLTKALNNPVRPFVSIIGGAKVSDKINIIKNMLMISDKVLIGGGMAYTFIKALGHEIGTSLLEEDKIDLAKSLLNEYKDKIVLPSNFAYSYKFENSQRQETQGVDIPKNAMGMDIGAATIQKFKEILKGTKTVIWNGPMGVFEFSNYKFGTESIAKAIASQDGIFSIIGGGDSAAAAIQLGFENKFSHISTGGGASLTFMEGKPLPAIEAIQNL